MVSRKKRMKASDTKLFKELYSTDTKEMCNVQPLIPAFRMKGNKQ